MPYDIASYWSAVGDEVESRGENVVAGDDSPMFRLKRERSLATFVKQLPLDGSLLEIGSGPGGNLEALREAGATDIAGVDIAPTMVRLGRSKGFDIQQVDGVSLPFEANAIDCVYSVTVLQHNPRIEGIFAEMCRVATNRVVLIEDTAPKHQGYGTYFRRTPAEYETLANTYGFKLVSSEPLEIAASELAHDLLIRFLDRSPRDEGAPIPRWILALEKAALRVTTSVDPIFPQRRGLTRMDFIPR